MENQSNKFQNILSNKPTEKLTDPPLSAPPLPLTPAVLPCFPCIPTFEQRTRWPPDALHYIQQLEQRLAELFLTHPNTSLSVTITSPSELTLQQKSATMKSTAPDMASPSASPIVVQNSLPMETKPLSVDATQLLTTKPASNILKKDETVYSHHTACDTAAVATIAPSVPMPSVSCTDSKLPTTSISLKKPTESNSTIGHPSSSDGSVPSSGPTGRHQIKPSHTEAIPLNSPHTITSPPGDIGTTSKNTVPNRGVHHTLPLVHLDVGGKRFKVSRSTLCRDPDSHLATFFNESSGLSLPEKDGVIYLQRNAVLFEKILAHLEQREYTFPETKEALALFAIEAKYFGLAELSQKISRAQTALNIS